MLDELGLAPGDQDVYRTLVTSGDLSVGDLAAALLMPPEEIRRSLDRLGGLGLVRWSPGDDAVLVVVEPEVGLEALLARKEAEAAERRAQLEQSRRAVESWLHTYSSSPRPAVEVRRLHGVGAVRDALGELARTCTSEVWSLNPGGAQSAEALERARPLTAATLERGVRIRSVFLDSLRNDEATVEHARWLTEQGGEVRTVPVLPLRLVLVDRAVAIVPLDAEDSSQGALMVTGKGLVSGLAALFLMTWQQGVPLGTGRRQRVPGRPSKQQWHALLLWAQGCTDDVVARQLGVSERTVRRIRDTLSAQVGASSRFELGVRAMALGWLTPDDLD